MPDLDIQDGQHVYIGASDGRPCSACGGLKTAPVHDAGGSVAGSTVIRRERMGCSDTYLESWQQAAERLHRDLEAARAEIEQLKTEGAEVSDMYIARSAELRVARADLAQAQAKIAELEQRECPHCLQSLTECQRQEAELEAAICAQAAAIDAAKETAKG